MKFDFTCDCFNMENELGGFSTCLFTTMDAPNAEKINAKHLNMIIQNEDDQDWDEILSEIQFVPPADFNVTRDILKDILRISTEMSVDGKENLISKG